jgi:hypothetical protein
MPEEKKLITRIEVQRGADDDLVDIWCRGRNAGSLHVAKGDGEQLARALLAISLYTRHESGPTVIFVVTAA